MIVNYECGPRYIQRTSAVLRLEWGDWETIKCSWGGAGGLALLSSVVEKGWLAYALWVSSVLFLPSYKNSSLRDDVKETFQLDKEKGEQNEQRGE